MTDPDFFFNDEVVVVTEKMDGECTTIYSDGTFHARSLDSKYHNTTQWVVRGIAERILLRSDVIPEGCRIVGENLQIQHAIHYNELPAFFMIFAAYDGNDVCLEWDQIIRITEMLDISTDAFMKIVHVPQLYIGPWDRKEIDACFTGVSCCGGKQEGYIVRKADAFPRSKHEISMAKYVRKDHVQEHAHNWRRGPFVPNKLKPKSNSLKPN
jgi:hypothetical protein